MYKPVAPISCPKCGTTVNVNTSMILTSNPPCYEWTCPNCGEKGCTNPKSTACDIPGKPFLQQGWQCPKCGAILAPNQNYCPFCSPSEYGRSNWVVTTPAVIPLEQYTNPNPSTAISLGDKPKKSGSTTVTFGTPCNIRTWTLE